MQTVTIAKSGTTSTEASFWQTALAAVQVVTRNGVEVLTVHGSIDGTNFYPIYNGTTALEIALAADSRTYQFDPALFRGYTKIRFGVKTGAVGDGGMIISVVGERFSANSLPTNS